MNTNQKIQQIIVMLTNAGINLDFDHNLDKIRTFVEKREDAVKDIERYIEYKGKYKTTDETFSEFKYRATLSNLDGTGLLDRIFTVLEENDLTAQIPNYEGLKNSLVNTLKLDVEMTTEAVVENVDRLEELQQERERLIAENNKSIETIKTIREEAEKNQYVTWTKEKTWTPATAIARLEAYMQENNTKLIEIRNEIEAETQRLKNNNKELQKQAQRDVYDNLRFGKGMSLNKRNEYNQNIVTLFDYLYVINQNPEINPAAKDAIFSIASEIEDVTVEHSNVYAIVNFALDMEYDLGITSKEFDPSMELSSKQKEEILRQYGVKIVDTTEKEETVEEPVKETSTTETPVTPETPAATATEEKVEESPEMQQMRELLANNQIEKLEELTGIHKNLLKYKCSEYNETQKLINVNKAKGVDTTALETVQKRRVKLLTELALEHKKELEEQAKKEAEDAKKAKEAEDAKKAEATGTSSSDDEPASIDTPESETKSGSVLSGNQFYVGKLRIVGSTNGEEIDKEKIQQQYPKFAPIRLTNYDEKNHTYQIDGTNVLIESKGIIPQISAFNQRNNKDAFLNHIKHTHAAKVGEFVSPICRDMYSKAFDAFDGNLKVEKSDYEFRAFNPGQNYAIAEIKKYDGQTYFRLEGYKCYYRGDSFYFPGLINQFGKRTPEKEDKEESVRPLTFDILVQNGLDDNEHTRQMYDVIMAEDIDKLAELTGLGENAAKIKMEESNKIIAEYSYAKKDADVPVYIKEINKVIKEIVGLQLEYEAKAATKAFASENPAALQTGAEVDLEKFIAEVSELLRSDKSAASELPNGETSAATKAAEEPESTYTPELTLTPDLTGIDEGSSTSAPGEVVLTEKDTWAYTGLLKEIQELNPDILMEFDSKGFLRVSIPGADIKLPEGYIYNKETNRIYNNYYIIELAPELIKTASEEPAEKKESFRTKAERIANKATKRKKVTKATKEKADTNLIRKRTIFNFITSMKFGSGIKKAAEYLASSIKNFVRPYEDEYDYDDGELPEMTSEQLANLQARISEGNESAAQKVLDIAEEAELPQDETEGLIASITSAGEIASKKSGGRIL